MNSHLAAHYSAYRAWKLARDAYELATIHFTMGRPGQEAQICRLRDELCVAHDDLRDFGELRSPSEASTHESLTQASLRGNA